MLYRPVALIGFVLIGCHSRDDHATPAATPGSASAPGSSAAAPVATPPPGPASPPADPCQYATKEEVGAAIGAPIVATAQAAPDQCAYYPAPPPSNALYVRVSDSSPYASMKQVMRNTSPVPGVGDDAIWAGPQLIVKAGGKMITIAVMDVRWNHGDGKAAAAAVARAVLPRLAP